MLNSEIKHFDTLKEAMTHVTLSAGCYYSSNDRRTHVICSLLVVKPGVTEDENVYTSYLVCVKRGKFFYKKND